MIESRYWKEDLLDHAKRLKPVKKPKRWSERRVVKFEKELILSFFSIRKLFETYKVSSKSRNHRTTVFNYPSKTEPITRHNQWDIDDVYEIEKERAIKKSILFLANQFIHSTTILVYRKTDRNWGGVILCSDYERDEMIYRVPIEEIIKIFELVGNDYPSIAISTWNEKKSDYVIETD